MIGEVLPWIPTSPLSQTLLRHYKALEKAKQDFARFRQEEKGKNSLDWLKQLRRHEEDVQISETHVVEVQQAMVEVMGDFRTSQAGLSWLDWTCEEVAAQIAKVNAVLWASCDVVREIKHIDLAKLRLNSAVPVATSMETSQQQLNLTGLDLEIQPKLSLLLDFGEYLKRSVAGTILLPPLVPLPRPASPSQQHINLKSEFAPLHVAQAEVIHRVIGVAYLLLYAHRDTLGAGYLLQSLQDPTISRLTMAWSAVSPKTKEVWQTLTSTLSITIQPEQSSTTTSARVNGLSVLAKDHLQLLSDLLFHHYECDRVTVLPRLDVLLAEIVEIRRLYGVASEEEEDVEMVLSQMGHKAMQEILTVLQQCQGTIAMEGVPIRSPPAPTTPNLNGRKEKTPRESIRRQSTDAVLLLLNKMPWERPLSVVSRDISETVAKSAAAKMFVMQEAKAAHWLLTRVYLSERDLWRLSLDYQPQREGEEVPIFHGDNTNALEVREIYKGKAAAAEVDAGSDTWSQHDESKDANEDDEAADEVVKIEPGMFHKLLLAAAGGATAPASLQQSLTEEDSLKDNHAHQNSHHQYVSFQETEPKPNETEADDDEEYQKRLDALKSILLPKERASTTAGADVSDQQQVSDESTEITEDLPPPPALPDFEQFMSDKLIGAAHSTIATTATNLKTQEEDKDDDELSLNSSDYL